MYLLGAISLGFLGSMHCIGMCGPIALALPVQHKTKIGRLLLVLVYNAGRIFTYALTGILFGSVGQGFVMVGWQSFLSIATGTIILLFLFIPLLSKLRPNYRYIRYPVEKTKTAIRKLFNKQNPVALFFIGILNGLLPCGLVYLAIAGSITTGTALNGALFMIFFGLGTVPAMLGLSMLGHYISLSFRHRIRKTIPFFAGAMALLLILRGLNLGIPYLSPVITTDTQGHAVHACCHK